MVELLNLTGRKRTPFIPQDEASECALACIAMVASYHGLDTDIQTLRRNYGFSLRGATLKQLLAVCERLCLNARPVRGDLADLRHLELPAILHWDLTHFVVLTRISQSVNGDRFHIIDPARGPLTLKRADFSESYTGVAVELRRSERFQAVSNRQQLRISHLWSSISGIWSTLRNVLLVSLVMQLVALALPFYTQIVIDTVFPTFDVDLLGVLAVGFGLLATVGLVANWLRGLIISSANSALSYQIIVNLFRHLTSLPLSWFERRHTGDIVSRFGSTQPITNLLSQGMVTAFVDGLLTLLTLVLMIVYSPLLTVIAVAALTIYVAIRFAFLRAVKLSNANVIATAARENSVFMETVRGAGAIKAFAQESNRMRIWQHAKADAVNAEVKLARLTSVFDALGAFVPVIERIVFLYIAIRMAFDGAMTIGMIFAFQAYKQQFLDAGIRMVQQFINFRVLQVHLGRLSDIALTQPESVSGVDQIEPLPAMKSGLTVLDLRFRYGPMEEEILSGVTFHVTPGETVALVGPSGGGKSTLLKLMIGLLQPSSGRILLDGRPLSSIPQPSWRRSLGYVAQDDKLFAGSLAENIAFFDPMLDMNRVREVATIAHVARDIEAMPMAYETRVGDMGSALSGGQKQRVLLARALYHRPHILFLDEGTANVDDYLERLILASLKNAGITLVMAAHRAHSIEAADRLYHVAGGRLQKAEKVVRPEPSPNPELQPLESREIVSTPNPDDA